MACPLGASFDTNHGNTSTLLHNFIVCKALSHTFNPLMPAGNEVFSNYYASLGRVSLKAKSS